MSFCYLLCFGQPIGNTKCRRGSACHYLGYTSNSLKRRLEQHRNGHGAKICPCAVNDYGRELTLVRHWTGGTRALERELKRRHNPKFYCPNCNTLSLADLKRSGSQVVSLAASSWKEIALAK